MSDVYERLTEEQKTAVNYKDGNCIVSAAAGSGKTTVLSERVLKRIEQDNLSCSRMLIVTFTLASAADMRTKICDVLRKEYERTHDKRLWQESLRIPYAQISTIDSFQASVVRENFKEAGVSPNFSMLDSAEQLFYETKVLNVLLEEYYSTYPDGFAEMLALFGGEGENETLSEAVGGLYNYLKAVPFAEDWLKEKIQLYNKPEEWVRAVCDEAVEWFEEIRDVYDEVLADSQYKEAMQTGLLQERKQINVLCEACRKRDLNGLADGIASVVMSDDVRFSGSSEADQRLKTFRDLFRDKLLTKTPLLNPVVLRHLEEDLAAQKKGIQMLFETVLEYSHRMSEEFKVRNKYSFDEISSLALQLVTKSFDRANGWYEISDIGREIRNSYDEIMIDECQDVNDRQNLFFTAISENNQFVVGDVKQSIYGFRRANPDNFISKLEDPSYKKIELAKNYRSRKGVLDFSNYLFERLFSKETGGIAYGEKEKLVYASTYPETEEPDVKVVALQAYGNKSNDTENATWIARESRRLVDAKTPVYQYTKNGYISRPLQYSDICVLLRNKTAYDVYRDAFKKCGVPIYATGGMSFLEKPEVNCVLMLLGVLEDPYDDINLFGTMTSLLFGFTAEELAQIRLAKRKGRLYTSVKKYAETDEKTASFVRELEHLKLLAQNLPIHRLIHYLYNERNYLSAVSYGDSGAVRRENLMSLYAFAKRFEDNADGNIASFLNFAEQMKTKKDDKMETVAAQGNFVHMMTVHASKGLEFPVCFVVAGRSSKADTRHYFFDDTLGVGCYVRSEQMDSERTTVPAEIIKLRNKRRNNEEELRLLYVAMTRAKEKLYVVTSVNKSIDKKLSALYSSQANGHVSTLCQRFASTDEELLWLAWSHHDLVSRFGLPFCETFEQCESPVLTVYEDPASWTEEEKQETKTVSVTAGLSQNELTRRFSFVYPNPLDKIPAGLSVTELIKHRENDPLYGKLTEDLPEWEPPAFLREEKLSNTQKGSAMHAFLQWADLSKPIAAEKERLVCEHRLTEEQAKVVGEEPIKRFVQSTLYQKLCKAERVRKEENFLISVPAKLYDSEAGNGQILLQGAMDAVYEYDDAVVVLDYKTDRCSEAELVNRYQKQLQLYAVAAKRLFAKPVAAAYIWSFALNREIKISLDTLPEA